MKLGIIFKNIPQGRIPSMLGGKNQDIRRYLNRYIDMKNDPNSYKNAHAQTEKKYTNISDNFSYLLLVGVSIFSVSLSFSIFSSFSAMNIY